MATIFLLEIVTPDRLLVSEQVEEMTAPGVEGEFGVLPGHTPFLTALKAGVLKYRKGKTYQHLAVSAGFAEVDHTKVTVLAETAELAQEIDLARAQAAKERALGRIKAWPKEDIDLARAQAALQRAIARIEAAGKVK